MNLLDRPQGWTWRAAVCVACLLAVAISVVPLRQSAAILAGLALVGALAIEPALGLAAVALTIPFGSLLPLPIAGVNVVDLLALATALAWLGRRLLTRRLSIHWPWLMWPVLMFLWATALSLTQANSWSMGVKEWLKWVEFGLLLLVSAQVADTRRQALIVAALAVAGLSEVAIGAYQFLKQVGPSAFILMGRYLRAFGTFNQPNPYAGYLGYLFPVAASLAIGLGLLAHRTRRPLPALLAAIALAASLCLLAGIGFSWSRGSWVGTAVAAGFVIVLRSRRSATIGIAIIAAAILVLLVTGTDWLPVSLSQRVAELSPANIDIDPARTEITDENFAVLERLAHWRAGYAMFSDHPWLGVGIGNFAAAYPDYSPAHFYDPLGHAHNIYINFLAESGVIGFATFVIWWLSAAICCWRASRRLADWRAALAIGVLGTLAYLSIHNLFDNLFVAHLQLQLALLLGLVCSRQTSAVVTVSAQ
jgi:putative inorganic carbon (hco3(-)) transporter